MPHRKNEQVDGQQAQQSLQEPDSPAPGLIVLQKYVMKINGCSGRKHTEQRRQIVKPGRRPVQWPPHAHVAQRAQRIHQGCRLLDPEKPHHLVFGESPIAEPPQGKYCDHPYIKCKLQLLILHLLKQLFFG